MWAGFWMAAVCATCPTAKATQPPPQRIVSINICTDELLVALVKTSRIAALSYLARDARSSSIVELAKTLPSASGTAEQALSFKPDLVLAGTFTTPATVRLLKRIGIRVEKIPIATSLSGLFDNLRRLGDILQVREKADTLIRQLKSRLENASADTVRDRPSAIFYQIGSVASGKGTLADDVLRAAGFRNIASEQGLHGFAPFPLEKVVFARPDYVILSRRVFRYQTPTAANLRHPALQHALRKNGFLMMPEHLLTCAKPATLEVIERLVRARKKRAARTR